MDNYRLSMLDYLSLLSENALTITISLIIVYTLYSAYYRLYLSPISSFPGPKLAALSLYYEFYYDVFPHYGQYYSKVSSLHAQYGPIIRISPYELHISSPDFYDTLYSTSKKRDKWYYQTRMFGFPESAFGTTGHAEHRVRRAAINPFFSMQSVRRLEPVIGEKVNICLERLRGLGRDGGVGRVAVIASAFSSDVIMMYCFGFCHKRLESPDFAAHRYEANHEGGLMGPVIKHNIWILWIIQSLPGFAVKHLGTALAAYVEMKEEVSRQISDIMTQRNISHKDNKHPTIFHEILDSKLPDSEKTLERLSDEAISIVSAGGETTSWALTVATYYVLANPDILKKLKSELRGAMPDLNVEVPAQMLEQLPYLSGVVKECLRLSYGVSTRLQRAPHEPLVFTTPEKEWIIPPFTPTSMTSLLIHHDESIFPDSHAFIPERWIENKNLDRYLVSFSKGSRQCVGQALANAEMHMWLAAVFRRFGSESVKGVDDEGRLVLVEADEGDVRAVADRFIAAVKKGSKGVRIKVELY